MKSTNELTDQELFDIAWKRAIEMKAPAITRGNDGSIFCLYRSDNGPCLLGAAVPDCEYQAKWDLEGVSAYQLVHEYGLFRKITFDPYELQHCHDSAAYSAADNPRHFKPAMLRNLREFARKHNLRIPGEPA